jgi:hypothetical protein
MPAAPATDLNLSSALWQLIRPGLQVATSVHLHVKWIDCKVRSVVAATGCQESASAYRPTGGAFRLHRDAGDEHQVDYEIAAGV